MKNLDPAAVQYANEKLWDKYPELNRRQLVMPEDWQYAVKWNEYYKEYKQQQIAPAPTSNPAPSSNSSPAPPPPTPAPVPPVQGCTQCPKCGEGSKACQDAINKGIDKNGNPIKPEIHKALVETHERVTNMLAYARAMDYNRAVDALEHWLNGCGKFKEIPSDKTDEAKERDWEKHHENLKEKVDAGLRTQLALAIESHGGQYPSAVPVKLEYIGGGKNRYWEIASDDGLAYFAETIHSRIEYSCTLIKGKDAEYAEKYIPEDVRRVCYECKAVAWKSWVEDNYDFEDDKGVPLPYLPADAYMNLLARYGCGANFQRSSRSWSNDPSEFSRTICYDNRNEVRKAAVKRSFLNQEEHEKEEEAKKLHRVPSCGPAEEMETRP